METKNYKYDATIFLPVHMRDSKRIKQFNEVGIVNCNQNKILLCFLTGTEIRSQEELNKHFSRYHENENIDLKYLEHNWDHPAAKVYNFYLKKEFYENSKWIVKIDDDTSTDIDSMMNFLNRHNAEKEYLFISKLSHGNVELTRKILERHDLYKKIEYVKSKTKSNVEVNKCKDHNLAHEHEILICSNKTISEVVEKFEYVIQERSMIADGFTDQLFFNLCKVTGIHGIQTSLIDSQGSLLQDYLSGWIFHIHNICPNRNPKIKEIVELIKLKENVLENEFSEIEYLLTLKLSNDKNPHLNEINSNIVKLSSTGEIISDKYPLKYWRIKNEKLQLLDETFKIALEYETNQGTDFLKQTPREITKSQEKFLSESYLIRQD